MQYSSRESRSWVPSPLVLGSLGPVFIYENNPWVPVVLQNEVDYFSIAKLDQYGSTHNMYIPLKCTRTHIASEKSVVVWFPRQKVCH